MAIIRSGASTDELTIDATSKAARVSLYASDGTYGGQKATYRGATNPTVVAPATTASFFIISGSTTQIVRIYSIRITAETLTTAIVTNILLNKYSTNPGATGTFNSLTQVPLDASDPAGTLAHLKVYTGAPTDGALIGPISSHRHLQKASATLDSGIPFTEIEWDFGEEPDLRPIVLRTSAQCIGAAFSPAPVSAVTLSIEVEWTESTT